MLLSAVFSPSDFWTARTISVKQHQTRDADEKYAGQFQYPVHLGTQELRAQEHVDVMERRRANHHEADQYAKADYGQPGVLQNASEIE